MMIESNWMVRKLVVMVLMGVPPALEIDPTIPISPPTDVNEITNREELVHTSHRV